MTADVKPRTIGHYELIRPLGEGAHGVVHQAWDPRLLRAVVIKVLKAPGGKAKARIIREARLASAIDHPNVAAIFDVGEEGGVAYLVMPFVPGRPLREVLGDGPLSVSLALSLGAQIADGLSAAHALGIVHRDLKPANVMVTEGGLVRILDFGLAVRPGLHDDEGAPGSSEPRGTVGYMAPEQFLGRACTEQTDVFALGELLYVMLAGEHPFSRPGGEAEVRHAVQFEPAVSLHRLRPEVPVTVDNLVRRCLEKAPADRVATAGEVRDGLRLAARQLSAVEPLPGQAGTSPLPFGRDRRPWFVRALGDLVGMKTPWTERSSSKTTLAVLPFLSLTSGEGSRYGGALADAIASRLGRLRGLGVRPAGSYLGLGDGPTTPLQAGEALGVTHVLSGSYTDAGGGVSLTWQLLDVDEGEVRGGGTLTLASLDLIALQEEVAREVYAALHGSGALAAPTEAAHRSLAPEVSETYLRARAHLGGFLWRTRRRVDLDKANKLLDEVCAAAPRFAPALAARGVARLQYARNGFGSLESLEEARAGFEEALSLDPGDVEAKLYRVFTLLALGEKESARHAVHHLLSVAAGAFDVHVVAATLLRLDGVYGAALAQLAQALELNPADAHVIYNQRARILHYQGDVDAALAEVKQGLALQPRHPLLRVSQAYLLGRTGALSDAALVLEELLVEEPTLQLAYPTLAALWHRAGDEEAARGLITEHTRTAADCDPETAYRLATYFATVGDEDEALSWLRRAIYLGNENYPWMCENPAWAPLAQHADFLAIMRSLAERHRRNATLWRRLLQ